MPESGRGEAAVCRYGIEIGEASASNTDIVTIETGFNDEILDRKKMLCKNISKFRFKFTTAKASCNEVIWLGGVISFKSILITTMAIGSLQWYLQLVVYQTKITQNKAVRYRFFNRK